MPIYQQITVSVMLRARIYGNKMAEWMRIEERQKETRAGSLLHLGRTIEVERQSS